MIKLNKIFFHSLTLLNWWSYWEISWSPRSTPPTVWLYLRCLYNFSFTVCLPCHSETYITYAKIWMEKTKQFLMHLYFSFFTNEIGNIRILTFDLKDTQQYGTKFLGLHFNFPIGQKWCVMRRVRLDNLNSKCWHFNVWCQIQTNTLLTASAIYFWNSTCNYC